jgi:sodium transport system ATP-binding protein
MIDVEKIFKSYGAVQAAAGVALKAKDAAITTLLGGNGSGKTTTLRAIAGLIRPDAGRTAIDGLDVRQNRIAALKRLGFFADRFGLYPRLTVREHLELSAALHGLRGPVLTTAVTRTIGLLDMGAIADRRTAGMSQGQQVKCALGRAIVHKPANLILDEPTRGLDIFAVRLLRDLLKRLRGEGLCILMSSHIMAEVAELSDAIVIIAQGRTIATGTPAQICATAGVTALEDAIVTLSAVPHERAAA